MLDLFTALAYWERFISGVILSIVVSPSHRNFLSVTRVFGQSAQDKRKFKAIKVRKDYESLNIGRDFALKKVESLSNRAIVGCMEYV